MAENEELETMDAEIPVAVKPGDEDLIERVFEEGIVEYVEVEPVELDPLSEDEETYTNRAFLFREYQINKTSMKDIAARFDVDELKVKKYLVDFDLYDPTRP